ncbi:hypothetical protein HG15A2_28890 [Adhaeretor mobilis]|uniref:Uncharacterized protein n=1 Tax=Adhaeretor mobilis TaxID=1930276 RepID=A0A517MXF3_9BACT|nr:hypothetical protein HG15A2_28890 [Adhaeretor mobilis]
MQSLAAVILRKLASTFEPKAGPSFALRGIPETPQNVEANGTFVIPNQFYLRTHNQCAHRHP